MPYDEKLAKRVREALADLTNVEEKKMFGGLAFMVDGKMCINIGQDKLMCRIDPVLHDNVVRQKGVETVKMKGRDYKGFIYINEDVIKLKKDLDHWLQLALDFNKHAKSSKKTI
jgi:TfoX/Sxy family transcriptional regulator of competence genes